MSLDTLLYNSLGAAPTGNRNGNALVLMGGGARTAYQVGVLKALADMLRLVPGQRDTFPFPLLVGTSAGAINAAYLAGEARHGLRAFDSLARFWSGITSSKIYELDMSPWSRMSRFLAAVQLSRRARTHGAILNNLPLVDTLHQAISLPGIDIALQNGDLRALAVTASSYSSGVHWTFCHTDRAHGIEPWQRPGRRAEIQPITIEHLMASSAIPFIFPATPLWVDGHGEYFGDGSMRQISPLSPALHLGARRVLVVGTAQPQRSTLAGAAPSLPGHGPSLGSIAGHAMASVFHDTLQADVEQTQRVTQTLRRLTREAASAMPYRQVEVLAIQPSQSLDAVAQNHAHALPSALRNALHGLGALKHGSGGSALASYLLFEQGFIQHLLGLGEQDAYAHKAQLLDFMSGF